MALARLHRVPALLGDLGGIVFLALPDIGVEHVGTGEKLGLGRARHQGGQGHALLVLQLVAQRLGEIVDEGFGRVIDRVERAGDKADDRPRHQHLAFTALDHRRQHPLEQIDGAGDVGVDRAPPVVDRLVEERPALAVARIGTQYIDGSTIGGGEQRIDTFQRRQVGLDRPHLGALGGQFAGGGVDGGFVGDDQQIIAVARRASRQMIADAGRGTRHDCEFIGHGVAPY